MTLHELDVTLAIEFILWNNQSLHCSRTMCWLQPQIWRHFTALRPERKIWSFSQVVWVIRNSDSTTIFLGIPKYWKPSCNVFLFGESEILNLLPCCLGGQKFWISSVVWGSEILNPLLCSWGIRNSESSPVLLGRFLWFLANRETFPVSFNTSLRLRVNCKNRLRN